MAIELESISKSKIMAKLRDMIQAMLRGDVEPPPVAKLIGFELTEFGDGVAQFQIETGIQHYNPMGTVHGGILCDIADGAMGVAFASTLEEEESFTTLELNINFFRPVWETKLVAIGKVVQRGQTVGYTECEITDAEGRLVAKASSTCMVLRGEAAKSR